MREQFSEPQSDRKYVLMARRVSHRVGLYMNEKVKKARLGANDLTRKSKATTEEKTIREFASKYNNKKAGLYFARSRDIHRGIPILCVRLLSRVVVYFWDMRIIVASSRVE